MQNGSPVRWGPPGSSGPPAAVPGEPGADLHWLRQAIGLSRRCRRSATAFSVGAILVSASGSVIATGFSRERDPADHAEEVALAKAAAVGAPGPAEAPGPDGGAAVLGASRLSGATIYSSLEPCRTRASRPVPCAALITASGLRRVVVAWLEPPVFVPGGGAGWLRDHGVTVVEIPELAAAARAVNAHLLGPSYP